MKTKFLVAAMIAFSFMVISMDIQAQTCIISCYSYTKRDYDVNIYLYQASPNWYIGMHETRFLANNAVWSSSHHAWYWQQVESLSDIYVNPAQYYYSTFYLHEELYISKFAAPRSANSGTFNYQQYYFGGSIVLPCIDLTSVPIDPGGGID